MFKNYVKTSWRSLIKNSFFSLINIIGLSIGMSACLLILEYVSFEMSFDQFNKNATNIYRIINDRYENGKLMQHGTLTYSAVSKEMKADFPEVINYTRMWHVELKSGTFIFYQDKKLEGQHELFVENSFLSMFSYPLVAGNPKIALAEPNTVVITTSLAKKIFNVNNNNMASVLGKTIAWGDRSNFYKITGVCADIPANSHLQFDCLFSYISLYAGKKGWKESEDGFAFSYFRHYLTLQPGVDYKVFGGKFAAFAQRHFQGNKIHTGAIEKFYLQPLLKIHMYSDLEFDIAVTTNATGIWGMLIIAVLILVIAWVNYINFTTALSTERAKEVGIRKVAGATHSQLVRQFMTESFMINIISLLIAFFLILISQASFNTLINQELSLSCLFQKSLGGYSFPVLLVILMLAGILISGFYPSFILSSYKPITVLKGKFTSSLKGIVLRRVLVIVQFTITVSLIICSIVVYRQLRFVSEQKLGFNMVQMLVIKGPELAKYDSTLLTKRNTFINAIKLIPGVLGATFSDAVPGDELQRSSGIQKSDQPGGQHFTMLSNFTGPSFISLYQMKLLTGRALSYSDYRSDGNGLPNLVINLAATNILGFRLPADAIGSQLIWSNQKYTIVGVVADYHQQSLHHPIEPTLFTVGNSPMMPFSVKVDPGNLTSTINLISQKYDSIFPGNLFDYYFLSDKFNQQYISDQLFGAVFTIFSGLAIFIACIGLLGLSLFASLQRAREIGIRKVLGASVGDIVITLSKDFIWLILCAILLASPIAWIIMHNWLQNFVARIVISWWIFASSGLLVAFIAFVTIGFQSVKAARANPLKSLNSE